MVQQKEEEKELPKDEDLEGCTDVPEDVEDPEEIIDDDEDEENGEG